MYGLFSRKKKKMGEDVKETEDQLKLRKFFQSNKTELKDFKMIRTLGSGTFGKVRLGTLTIDGKERPFALKILSKAEVCRLKQIEHVKSERACLYALSHNFIVKLFQTFQDKKNLYLVMEYAIGGDLFSYLRKKGKLDHDESRFYAAEITVALSYIHMKGIVYRDLKPENILIDQRGHLKLADFGFGKKLELGKRTWTLCGTPEYLAPEVIHSTGHNVGVDWWAFGVLLFEMLSGFPPFYDEQPFAIYQKICLGIGKVEFPKHIDPKAKHLIKSLLEENYTKRLGCIKNGGYDVRKHKWFKGLGFKKIMSLSMPAPYVPEVKSPIDTSHFDSVEEEEDDIDKGVQTLTKVDDEKFAEF